MKTTIDLYVIEMVKKTRKAKDYSQEALSFALGFDGSFIRQFENGKATYNVEQFNNIAKILNCSPGSFYRKKQFKVYSELFKKPVKFF